MGIAALAFAWTSVAYDNSVYDDTMRCKLCGSVNQRKFIAEMGIRSPGPKGLDKPVVWVFPEVVVCLNCGISEFAVPEAELRELAKGDAAAAG
jgi:hypothetical protein